jgi:hypothetical protein
MATALALRGSAEYRVRPGWSLVTGGWQTRERAQPGHHGDRLASCDCCMYDGRMATNLTRLTVNLIPKADAALNHAADATGLSRTDTVNRALQVYDYLVAEMAKGADLYVGSIPDSLMRLKII